jgi:hypothetical protein
MDNDKLLARIEAMIGARNDAHDAQQRFSDAHVVTEPDETSDALYEATYELLNRIDNVILSVEWQNLMLGISD